MSIPVHQFLNLKKLHASIGAELNEALTRVVTHSQFINGPEVAQFETKWADYCNAPYAVGCSNGTAALHAILQQLRFNRSDEVIVPSHTFIATAESVRLAGATPRFVDVNPETWTLDRAAVEQGYRSRVKAIVAVHLYGMPVDMDPINEFACAHNIPVIEDAAQGHGARYKGRSVGSLGLAAAFSFFPGKNLGALGDAGGITTIDRPLAEAIRLYVNHGRLEKYEHIVMGNNYRLDTMQAALLLVKLRHLELWNNRRRALAARYREILSGEPFASAPVRFQADTPGAESAFHLFVVTVPNRDAVVKGLNERGVQTGIHYPIPCHLQKSMADVWPEGDGTLLVTERLASSILSLPMCPTMDLEDVDNICHILRIVLTQ
jgi:dTDP-4-amino-4,6-dideoxygalactose transaminase